MIWLISIQNLCSFCKGQLIRLVTMEGVHTQQSFSRVWGGAGKRQEGKIKQKTFQC